MDELEPAHEFIATVRIDMKGGAPAREPVPVPIDVPDDLSSLPPARKDGDPDTK